MKYTLTVTAKKNGTFDHVVTDEAGAVTDEAGAVIGTRNSVRQYRSACITRGNRESILHQALRTLTYNQGQLAEYRAVVAAGRVPAEYAALKLDDYRGFISNLEATLPRDEAAQGTGNPS